MRQELKNIEYIEHYLEGSLSKADEYKFEQYMQENPDFEETVELQRQLTEQLKEEAFLNDVSAFHQNFSKTGSTSSGNKSLWFFASALLLLISASIWWLINYNSTQPLTNTTETNIKVTEKNPPILPANIKAFQTPFISKKIRTNTRMSIPLQGSNTVLHIPEGAIV